MHKAAALAQLERMTECIRRHIESGECTEREVSVAFDAFKSTIYSEETDCVVSWAVERFRQEIQAQENI